jgi:hypothetical protein
MSFKSHVPFHRQISGSLIFLYLSFIFIIGITSFLLYQRNVQINELVKNQIPELEFVYQYKEYLKLNHGLVLALNDSESSDELADAFNNIKTNLENIANLDLINVRNVNRLIAELNEIDDVVERVITNDPRNNTLKQVSVVQLGILSNTLVAHIDLKNQEQLKLHKKVTINGVNGYIPAARAIQYVDVTRVLNQLNKSLVLLDEATLGFEALSLKYTVDQLEEITKKIDLAITHWLSALSSDPIDVETRAKIENLQTLLNVDQRVLGKWYSHLRLSEEIFNRVGLINQKLLGLYPSHNQQTKFVSSDYIIPDFITQLSQSIQYKITTREYYYGLIGLFILSLLFVLVIVFRFRKKVQVYGDNTVELCANILSSNGSSKEQSEYIKTAEQLRISGLIQQIQKPKYSENDYQKLQGSYEQDLSFINKQHHIIIWKYQPYTTYIDLTDFLSNLTPEYSDKKVSSWRHLFNRKNLSEIISIAKDVRVSQVSKSYSLKSEKGVQLEVLIDFDGTSWFGTLSHHRDLELLKNSVNDLEIKHKNFEHTVEEERSEVINKFSQMVLRAMVQSQGSSIDINGSTLPIYRQLTRMLDWCGQTDIVSELKRSPKSVQKFDINFKEELHAIILNAMSEARFQKNSVYLKLDKLLLLFANIDHCLFHKMLTGIIRVLLAELFNAKMLLDIQVVDTDTGNQTVQFTFTVSTLNELKRIPDLVTKLVNGDQKSTLSSSALFYLNSLMQRFNVNQIQSKLNDDGFNFMFRMPLVVQDIHPADRNIKTINLRKISIVSVGACAHSQSLIKDNLTEMNNKVIKLSGVDELIAEYTVEALERKPVSLIIVNDDVVRTRLGEVKAFQMSLPENLRPKIFVIQSPINAKYHKQGLYNQASVPLFRRSFQNKVNELLNSKALDNLLIDADILDQYQYLPSRVELLLAVSAPEEHQVLLCILQWLGVQVHVVSQPNAMLKKWQSGRYLLLISEFSESPQVRFSTGNNVQRGIFTFKKVSFKPESEKQLDITKHWKVSTLPDVLDIKTLVNLLEPWLKSKAASITQLKHSDSVNVQQHQSYNEFLNETNKLGDADKEYLNQYHLLGLNNKGDQGSNIESRLQTNILDLEKYAFNQGSSELASYMLDEYLSNIDIAIGDMEKAINKQSHHDMQKPIHIILKLSEVLGANDLNVEVLATKALIENDSMKNDFSVFKEFIARLTSHLKALESFSEAI